MWRRGDVAMGTGGVASGDVATGTDGVAVWRRGDVGGVAKSGDVVPKISFVRSWNPTSRGPRPKLHRPRLANPCTFSENRIHQIQEP